MFAKSEFEPIEDSGELNKGEKGDGEFFVARAQTAIAFDSTKEVFDAMTTMVKPAAKGTTSCAVLATRNAGVATNSLYAFAHRVGVEPFVTDQGAAAQPTKMRLDRLNLAALPRQQTQRDSSAIAVSQSGQLRIETALGQPDALGLLSTGRIGTVLVEFDVG